MLYVMMITCLTLTCHFDALQWSLFFIKGIARTSAKIQERKEAFLGSSPELSEGRNLPRHFKRAGTFLGDVSMDGYGVGVEHDERMET